MSSLSPSSPSGAKDRSPSGRRSRGDRVLLVSLAISALLHLLAVLVLPRFYAEVDPPPGAREIDGGADRPDGIEVVQIVELPDAASPPLPDPAAPVEPEEAAEPPPEEEPAVAEAPQAEPDDADPGRAAGGEATVAERLRAPESGDPRIWRPVSPELTDLTPEDRALLRIYASLRELADSLLTEEERERRAREWLFTDAEGREWGISPGRIHLGDTSVPIPFTFSAPPSVGDAGVQWQYDDVNRAADVARVREAWDERREAIRERMDAEREEARRDAGGEDRPVERPDSSGSGG